MSKKWSQNNQGRCLAIFTAELRKRTKILSGGSSSRPTFDHRLSYLVPFRNRVTQEGVKNTLFDSFFLWGFGEHVTLGKMFMHFCCFPPACQLSPYKMNSYHNFWGARQFRRRNRSPTTTLVHTWCFIFVPSLPVPTLIPNPTIWQNSV